jgi:hypothetical protein
MRKSKTKTLIAILTAAIMLLIPIVALAADPPVLLPKTGQTKCYADNGTEIDCTRPEAAGQDGDLQLGEPWPDPRFTDNGDGTVTDNLTGLIWTKEPGHFRAWTSALNYANNLSLGSESCGTSYTDWRMPNRFELESLLDLGNDAQALPFNLPFVNVLNVGYMYWSSSYNKDSNGEYDQSKIVRLTGYVGSEPKSEPPFPYLLSVWPVRGGN